MTGANTGEWLTGDILAEPPSIGCGAVLPCRFRRYPSRCRARRGVGDFAEVLAGRLRAHWLKVFPEVCGERFAHPIDGSIIVDGEGKRVVQHKFGFSG